MQALVQEAARLFDIRLSARQVGQMQRHADELALWNRHVNLTAITDPQEVLVRHFLRQGRGGVPPAGGRSCCRRGGEPCRGRRGC